jgi:hypothetical protein
VSEGVRKARAQLEMVLDARAPEGMLSSSDGRRFPFRGWTELAAAIEEWRSSARSPRSGDGGGGPAREEGVRNG